MIEEQRDCFPMAVFEYKVFNDPIHGHIELHPLCVRIIDTPQFQRLRYIKQLGGCYLVFPGASHNRFEHSIGVSHLAGELAKAIQQRQPELAITDQDILCVQIAGLCHDLGHGPFSHMFQDFIHTVRPNEEWKHEKASVQMFEHLLEENNLRPIFESYKLTPSDVIFIKEQIASPFDKGITRQNWPYSGRDGKKSFLYEIVANKRNGIDVDKWDYFARDCHHLGIKSGFDHHRFIGFCRVISDDGVMQICNRDKEVFNVYDMFHIRSVLHRTAYQHKTAKIVEIMITEALQKADKLKMIEGKDGFSKHNISGCIDDMVAYTKLTDTIYHKILYSSDPQLSEARDILHRIESRKLYKYVGQTKPSESSEVSLSKDDEAQIREQIALSVGNSSDEPLINADDIVLSFVKIDYGDKTENPIDSFRFYRKSDLNKAVKIKKEQVSPMLPRYFSYQFMVVYSRKLDSESIKNISTGFKSWCKKNNLMECEDEDV